MTAVGFARHAERLAWTLATITFGVWVLLQVDGRVAARQEIDRFRAARSGRDASTPDFSLWSPHAIDAWRASRAPEARVPLGVLRISRLGLEAPILEGTAQATLDRGLGRIEDTATLGSTGNIGIAGHRDSFFRVLKDIAIGDAIELQTLSGSAAYRVERTWLVQPEDVWVLDPTTSPALTLVTCYPFYYNGSAPQRFIVRALRMPAPGESAPLNRSTASSLGNGNDKGGGS
jgi:sortase A